MAKIDVVFEGGGAKGCAFGGALEVLRDRGFEPRRLVGTSAGAIAATLWAAGYSPEEMLHALTEEVDGRHTPRMASFLDPPLADDFTEEEKNNNDLLKSLRAVHDLLGRDLEKQLSKSEAIAKARGTLLGRIVVEGVVGASVQALEDLLGRRLIDALLTKETFRVLFSLDERGGIFAGRAFREWVEERLEQKGLDRSLKLAAFADKTGVDLSLVAADTTAAQMLVLNPRTAPRCPVAWAVRMSTSIPFVWQEVAWQDEWGLYYGHKASGESKAGHSIVDGGVISNFPMRLIVEDGPQVQRIMGQADPKDAYQLGLLIDESLPEDGDPNPVPPVYPYDQMQVVQRIYRLSDTMMSTWDNDIIREHEAMICRLPARGYRSMDFAMSPDRRDKLIADARAAMQAHLRKRPG